MTQRQNIRFQLDANWQGGCYHSARGFPICASLVVEEPGLYRWCTSERPTCPLRFTTMEASMAEVTAAPRFRTLLLAIFAALAVCLAMAGVYGVLVYVVSQRSSEIYYFFFGSLNARSTMSFESVDTG